MAFRGTKDGNAAAVQIAPGGKTGLFVDNKGNVGVGATDPMSTLSIKGGLTIGTSYAGTNAAPDNVLIVEGKVGIGMTGPGANLDVSGKVNTEGQISLQLRSGNMAANYESNQITLGYGNNAQYRHAIKSRHHSGQTAGNAIDFYVWQYGTETGAADKIGGLHAMTLNGGNVGIGATGPEAKLDVNGDVIVSGAIKGRYTETRNLDSVDTFKNRPIRKGYVNSIVKQQPAIIQGLGWGNTANESGNTADPHLFTIGYHQQGNFDSQTIIFDITTGSVKTFVIDHPLDQDKYLIHATLEGPEGAVYYRGTARLNNGKAQVQLPAFFEALTRADGRTILLTNVDGFDPLAVLTQDGAQIKDGGFIVGSSNKESTQVFDWEVKAIRKDIQALEVEPLKSAVRVERFGPYTYAVPVENHRTRTEPVYVHSYSAEPQTDANSIPGACGPRSKISNIR